MDSTPMDATQLRSIQVFATLDDAVRAELAQVVEERRLEAGEQVFAEGDPGDTLFAIADGMIRIEKQIAAGETAAKTLSLLTRGELFGEMSVIDSRPRSASAVAAEPTRLVCVSRTAFEALLARNPQCAVGLLFSVMRAMNERVRRLNSSVVAYDEVGHAIGVSERLGPLLDQVLRQLQTATGADRGLIFLKSEFRGEQEPRSTMGIPLGDVPAERADDPASLAARVAAQAHGWLIGDRSADPRCSGLERRSWETSALLLAPITVASGGLGVVVLGHPEPGRFDVNHLNLAEGIARQTAQAILNLRHREEQQSRARLGLQFVKF
ncbi:MAG: cyclic nucleotide-binding domain-containing protein [Verrucomicrobia bacterium]|nr:cyclic nucleotide-binding domain-containing protein [Verrucomicrobiota bacterium]